MTDIQMTSDVDNTARMTITRPIVNKQELYIYTHYNMINTVTINCTCLITMESYENTEHLVPPTRVRTYAYIHQLYCVYT